MVRKETLITSFGSKLMGILIPFLTVNTCQRFEPDGFLHVTTDTIEALADRNYKLIGTIVSIGEENITQHGFCWSDTDNPTTERLTAQLGSKESKGSFTYTISDLSSGTKYYVRAYVITAVGTEYGKEKSFTTMALSLPAITSTAVTNVTQDSAKSGGINLAMLVLVGLCIFHHSVCGSSKYSNSGHQ